MVQAVMENPTRTHPMGAAVETAFATMPSEAGAVLRRVREQIMAQSSANSTIGKVTETLKWGQPSYLTEQTKSGSTLRLGVTKESKKPAIFVHCQSSLAEEIRELYGDTLSLPDKRHVVLPSRIEEHADALDHIVSLILTYHARKNRK
ncbi:MAG: DUF1801 domain-containing protein [Pseudomonadota bacterium]